MRRLSVADDQHTLNAIAGIARHLIQQIESPAVPLDADGIDGIDVDLALIDVASSVLTQLGLLQQWFITGGEHPRSSPASSTWRSRTESAPTRRSACRRP